MVSKNEEFGTRWAIDIILLLSSRHNYQFSNPCNAVSELFLPRLKPRPNDRNMPTQHIATLLGATCCVRLATLLRRVATCCSNLMSQQHPTCRNTSRWHVATLGPGLNTYTGWERKVEGPGLDSSPCGMKT